jgi:hypothetical protein
MKFINYKLFTDIGLKVDSLSESFYLEDHLNVDYIKEIQKLTRVKFEIGQKDKDSYNISEEFKQTAEIKKLTKKEESMKKQRELLSGCVFMLFRESPIYCLQHVILSFGGYFITDEE